MARRNDAALLAELDALGVDEPASSTASQPVIQAATAAAEEEQDDGSLALDDIQKALAAKSSQTSRPITPRLSSSTTSGNNKSPKLVAHTPASSGPSSQRNSEERGRSSGQTAVGLGVGGAGAGGRSSGEMRSYHTGSIPGEEAVPVQQQQEEQERAASGGGWWGSMFSKATAAVSTASNLAKEIASNEEAQKWEERFRGGLGGLSTLSKLCNLTHPIQSTSMKSYDH